MTTHRILTGHDPSLDIDPDIPGTDLLLQVWTDADGNVTTELAVRPGHNRRDITWGPPALLLPEPVGSVA